MSRCPLTYQVINDGLYSKEGIRKLNNRLATLLPLEFTQDELLEEAAARSVKISPEGVQPKLSAILSVYSPEKGWLFYINKYRIC